ncbi:MAG: alpha-hydroxy-acid oxidizing protein [Kineosporiaceae bacterium]
MTTTRRLPRPSELLPLLNLSRPQLDLTARRLAGAHSIADLRAVARRRTPRAVFDYTDGAAEAEISLRRARAVFGGVEFQPSVLRDVADLDLTVHPLDRPSAVPFAFAPTGFTRLMHHEGESAVAAVAGRRGIPYALSTMGTTSIEDVAAVPGHGRLWFQLYVWRDRAAAEDLLRRAQAAGYEALMLTVDVPVAGGRLRDARNGLTIPPSLSLRTLADMALYPAWWANLLTTRPLEFASLTQWSGTVAELLDTLFDPTMTVDDLAWLRSVWSGPLIVKGVQTVADARRVVDHGADAVVLSNHGGRQLDRAPVPLRLVPDVVDAVGDRTEVWVDTGVMSGADVVAGLALGARLVLVGRAYLYGLMAGGERGVDRAAEILTGEVSRTMRLLGVRSVAELSPSHVRLP